VHHIFYWFRDDQQANMFMTLAETILQTTKFKFAPLRTPYSLH
jgi:hypothetical protein